MAHLRLPVTHRRSTNDLAHANNYAVTREAAKRVCNRSDVFAIGAERALQLIES